MVLTRAQEQRLSRLEDMFAERSKMMEERSKMMEQLADMVEALSRSTAGFPKSIDKMASQLQLQEELQSSNVLLEEKSKPEAQEENPKLENQEGGEQIVTLEVEGDVEKGQEVQSMEKICSAHQVFDKMSLGVQSKRRQIKCHKSWRFKFKQRKQQRGKPRIAHKLIYKGILMVDSEDHLSNSMVKEIGIEISSDRWLSNSIGCELETGETVIDEYRVPSDSVLVVNDIEKDKERLKWKKRRKSLKSWRFKFKSRDLRGYNLSRVTLLLKNSLVITGSWRRFMMVKGYEQGHLLEHANIEAESFLLLNFAAEQPFLWMQNNSEPVLTVSELERKKKKLCYKTWMFKYKAPLKGVQFLHYCDKEVPKETNWAVQRIWNKDSHEVHITDANEQTEYTREGRRGLVNIYDWCILSQLWLDHRNQTGSVPIEDLFKETDAYFLRQEEFEQLLKTTLIIQQVVRENQAWIENAWFKIQVFSDFDIASWVGLEIYGCETKKQTLLIVKLANRVWERGKLLAIHLNWELFGLRAWIGLEIYGWKYKKQINIGLISLNGMCNKLVYDEEKKKLRHVGDDVKKGKNSFLGDVKVILASSMEELHLLQDVFEMVKELLLKISLVIQSLVIQQVMRSKKFKFLKRWMFKYKTPHLDTQVFETSDQCTRKRVFVGADRLTQNNQPTLRSLMNTKQSCPSLRANRVWDPGVSSFKNKP